MPKYVKKNFSCLKGPCVFTAAPTVDNMKDNLIRKIVNGFLTTTQSHFFKWNFLCKNMQSVDFQTYLKIIKKVDM